MVSTGRGRHGRYRPTIRRLLPVAVLAVGLLVNGVILVRNSLGVWFWADDWDYLFVRGTIPQYDQGLFAPHNNHWITSQILVYRLLFTLFGMGSYTPYAVVEVCVHLATVAVSYALLRRAGTGRWISVVAALVVAFFGLGANAEIYAASMNHVGALLFGLVAALIATTAKFGIRRQILTSAALLAALTFGLTALAMLVFVAVLVATTHGLRRAALVLTPPAAVFVAWWLRFGREAGSNSITPHFDLAGDLPHVPSYVWTGLTKTLGDGSGLAGAGPLLVVLMLFCLVTPGAGPVQLVRLARAGVAADVFQLVVVSIGRFDFGPDQLGASHYSYINVVLLTPAIALVGTRLASWIRLPRWQVAVLVAALFVAYALNGLTFVQKWHDDFTLLTGGSRQVALGIRDAVRNDEKVLAFRNPDPFDSQLNPKYVATPQIMSALGGGHSTAEGLLRAESYFFTGVGGQDYGLAKPADLTAYAGFAKRPIRPGCHRLTATEPTPILKLRTGSSGNEVVVWSNSTTITTRLQRGDTVGPDVTWKATPGAMHIATSAPDAVLFISFNGSGSFTICTA